MHAPMHAKKTAMTSSTCCCELAACMHKQTKHTVHANSETKKIVAIKLSIKIKFKLHNYLSYNKIFKTRPHLSMFARYFLKIFF